MEMENNSNNSPFNVLSKINVNAFTEKKGRLTYLSWAWAWGELKSLYPDSFSTVYESSQGFPYHTDGRTAWVKVGVTVEGLEHIEYLPVMDHKNKSLQLEDITSFDVNTSLQRAMTKAIARHGLGLYIYAGEDLPPDGGGRTADEIKREKLLLLASSRGYSQADLERIAQAPLEELDSERLDKAVDFFLQVDEVGK